MCRFLGRQSSGIESTVEHESLPLTPGSTQGGYVSWGYAQVAFSWQLNQVESNLISALQVCCASKLGQIEHAALGKRFCGAGKIPCARETLLPIPIPRRGQFQARRLGVRPTTDSERTPPCARAHARARETIEEFRLGSVALPARPMVSRARRYHDADHADIGAGLDGAA
jgi:hypothetical protein